MSAPFTPGAPIYARIPAPDPQWIAGLQRRHEAILRHVRSPSCVRLALAWTRYRAVQAGDSRRDAVP